MVNIVGLTGYQRFKNNITILKVIHLFLPLIVLLYTNYMVFYPSTQLQYLSPLKYGNSMIKNWKTILPLVGQNRNQSWSLGECEGKLIVALEVSNNKAIDSAITFTENTISTITLINKNKPLTTSIITSNNNNQKDKANYLLQQIKKIKEDTMKEENKKGLSSYMTNMFTFINFIWLISIIGILVSVGPFLTFIFYDIIVKFYRIAMKLWYSVVSHLWRPILYIFVLGIFSSACDDEFSLDIRVYTSFLAAGLLNLAVLFTLFQIVKVVQRKQDEIVLIDFISIFGFLIFLPLSLITGSKLLGFITVIFLYTYLGFGVHSMWGGYSIGYRDENDLDRSCRASVILLLIDMLSIATGIGLKYIEPFNSGLQSLGATAMYIALLIKYSKFNYYSSPTSILNFKLSLLLGAVIGNIVPMIGLRNCSYVFMYLCALDYIAFYGNQKDGIVAFFCCSLFLCIGCYILHLNPSVFASLYLRN